MARKKELAVTEKKAIDKSAGEPTKHGVVFTPNVDIYETEQEIVVKADLPGVSKDGLDIDLRDGVLTLTAQVEQQAADNERLVYQEYQVGGFARKFQVGETIDQTKISAKLDKGVLTLILPKADRHKPRKIDVTVS